MNKTNIEWTDATWNPIRGCSRVSEGCRNCYAEKVAYRFSGPGQPYEGLVGIFNGTRKPVWNGTVQFVEKHLLDPLKWKGRPLYQAGNRKPVGYMPGRRVFVNSMSDLFHENVPDEWIDKIFAVMALAPQHTFQVLTKRPARMLKYLTFAWDERIHRIAEHLEVLNVTHIPSHDFDRRINAAYDGLASSSRLPNVWLGVSVEDQKAADERIPLLLQTPAAVRFISAEPLLGRLDLERGGFSLLSPVKSPSGTQWPGLDWVIAGGESGPGARPFNTDWAVRIVDQCRTAGVACFVKQLGGHVIQGGERRIKRDKKGGDMDEWPHEIRVREFPEVKH